MLGHELLDCIKLQPATANVAAMLRHAERYPITNPDDPTLAELTPDGMAAARALGARITGFPHLRLYHSAVKRCRQTVECLAEGAASKGMHVEIAGEAPALGVFYITDLVEAGRMHVKHGDSFIRLWFDGKVRDGIVQPPEGIATRKLGHIAERLADVTPHGRRLDLHVSHDWNIIILREMLLGVRHEEAGWLTFLDGITFTLGEEGRLAACYREHRAVGGVPWADFRHRTAKS